MITILGRVLITKRRGRVRMTAAAHQLGDRGARRRCPREPGVAEIVVVKVGSTDCLSGTLPHAIERDRNHRPTALAREEPRVRLGTHVPLKMVIPTNDSTLVTVDGYGSGEIPNLLVSGVGESIEIDHNGFPYYVQNTFKIFGTNICQDGDSGGPVFYVANGAYIQAAGEIIAYDETLEPPSGPYDCYAELIGAIESHSNTHTQLWDQ